MESIVCECSDGDCSDSLEVTALEYAEVRAHPTRFLLATGHEDLSIERVIHEAPAFTVVEKPVAA
jgi:hypothetical protein